MQPDGAIVPVDANRSKEVCNRLALHDHVPHFHLALARAEVNESVMVTIGPSGRLAFDAEARGAILFSP